MKKKCPLVMLASQKAEGVYETCLWLNSNNKLNYRFAGFAEHQIESVNKQHLYILSGDEIKAGDWYYSSVTNLINKHKTGGLAIDKFHYKIIATTNPELWKKNHVKFGHPIIQKSYVDKISLDFVDAYIKAYNKGEQIKEVMVEYFYEFRKTQGGADSNTFLKVSSNGIISITPVEETKYTQHQVDEMLDRQAAITTDQLLKERKYTREEVIAMLSKFGEACDVYSDDKSINYHSDKAKDWFDNNYSQ